MKKIGYVGVLTGIRKNEKEKPDNRKSFTLLYDPEKPILYSSAKVTIGGKTIFTDKAIWDTGATMTFISHATAERFGTVPDDHGTSISATDRNDADIYLATVELPGGIIFRDIEVWDVDLSHHGAEVVIGMDIISKGKLVVETVNNIPTFSFSIE